MTTTCSHPYPNEYSDTCRAVWLVDDYVRMIDWLRRTTWDITTDWASYDEPGQHDPGALYDWIRNHRTDDSHPLPCACDTAAELRDELAGRCFTFLEEIAAEHAA